MDTAIRMEISSYNTPNILSLVFIVQWKLVFIHVDIPV